jgi:hypothetical protein
MNTKDIDRDAIIGFGVIVIFVILFYFFADNSLLSQISSFEFRLLVLSLILLIVPSKSLYSGNKELLFIKFSKKTVFYNFAIAINYIVAISIIIYVFFF